jgi:hypothetical protein
MKEFDHFISFRIVCKSSWFSNFFQVILSQFFNGFEINVKFFAFDTLIRFLWIFFPVILISMFCELWIQRRTKLLKIAKNVYCRLYEYIRVQFCILQQFRILHFLKKGQNRCTLLCCTIHTSLDFAITYKEWKWKIP